MTRPLAVCSLALCALAFAAQAEGPRRVSVEFRGSLKDGLREIASKGGLNLIATGELSEPAEVYLKDVSAEDALGTVAAAYHLKVFRQGTIWTLRPMTAEEVKGAEQAGPVAGPAAATAQPTAPPAMPAAATSQPPAPVPAGAAISQPAAPATVEAAPSAQRVPPVAPIVPNAAPVPPAAAAPIADAPPSPVVDAPHDPAAAHPPPSERETRSRILEKLKSKRAHKSGNDLVSTDSVEVEDGQIVDSAVSYGSSVTVKSGGVVQDDVVAFGGDVVLEPGAVVEGDAVAFGGKVDKDEGAVVEGDVVSFGGLGAVVAKGVTLSAKHDSNDRGEHRARSGHGGGGLSGFFLRFAVLFGLGFLFIMFAPTRMKAIEGELKSDPVKCALTGLLGSVALAVLSVMLVGTLVGIPAALALWTMVGVGVAMGVAAIASALGLRLPIFRTKKSQAVVLAAGLLLMLLAAQIPVLGTIMVVAVALTALGAIIRTRFGQPPRGMPQPDSAV